MRSITFFQAGNGNFSLVQADNTNILMDMKSTEDKTSWEIVKPFLKKDGKKYILDVLSVSHGDQDHCGGYTEFQKLMDEGKLVIGSIWHPDYDRTEVSEEEELPEDYLMLHKEILRRQKIKNPQFGEIQIPLTTLDDEKSAFNGLQLPTDLKLKVLNPHHKDQGDTEWDVNDSSLVIKLSISGLRVLFTGDSSSEVWQTRIIPLTLKKNDKSDWAEAQILVASHHGSATFFGVDRETVLNAKPTPENYKALDYIKPEFLVLSASTKFPTSGDESGDLPPHYAAWKWYHKWFRENKNVKESDNHPDLFKYTANGHVRLQLGDDKEWRFKENWTPDDDPDKGSDVHFTNKGGGTKRQESGYA